MEPTFQLTVVNYTSTNGKMKSYYVICSDRWSQNLPDYLHELQETPKNWYIKFF